MATGSKCNAARKRTPYTGMDVLMAGSVFKSLSTCTKEVNPAANSCCACPTLWASKGSQLFAGVAHPFVLEITHGGSSHCTSDTQQPKLLNQLRTRIQG